MKAKVNYDSEVVGKINQINTSNVASINKSTYSPQFLTQDFINNIFKNLNEGDTSCVSKIESLKGKLNSYMEQMNDIQGPNNIVKD